MHLLELCIVAVSLATDAFAVAVSQGLKKNKSLKDCFIVAIYFGFFQSLMPYLGYYLGIHINEKLNSIDNFIAFFLLTLIGGKMLYESFKNTDEDINLNEEKTSYKGYHKNLIMLSIATSIDALAVGVSFAFLNVNIYEAVLVIGIITFLLSFIGVMAGRALGDKFKNKAELLGGIILILIGIKILIQP